MMKRIPMILMFLLLLAACGGDSAENEVVVVEAGPSAVQVLIGSDDFHVGSPRIPILLMDGIDPATGIEGVDVTLFDLSVDPPAPVWEGVATAYVDYEVPYWTVFPEISAEGNWGLNIEATLEDGSVEAYQRSIAATALPRSPALDTVPPASVNRTIADTDIDLLTSGRDPNPDLYDQTIAEAIDSGKPSVITFATPAFCQTRVCAPVVGSMEAIQAQVGDSVNVLHIEVYKDFQELTISDEMVEWGLTTEPWTFVLNGDGEIVSRMGGPVAPTEILDVLGTLGIDG